jgi:hypothetical protein
LEVVGEMANAVASMAGLRGASQVVLEGAFVISSSTRVPSRSNSSGRRVGASGKPGVVAVRAQQSEEGEISAQSRRSVLGLLAASVAASALVKEAQAAPTSIKIEGPPPLSGGLPGTDNADEARDTDLPQKQRFFIPRSGRLALASLEAISLSFGFMICFLACSVSWSICFAAAVTVRYESCFFNAIEIQPNSLITN